MNVFEEVYEKSIELLKAPALVADWKPIEDGLKKLLQADGPAMEGGKVLDDLRQTLRDAAKKISGKVDVAKATEILRAAQPAKNGFQDRAALIKQMEHFYLVAKKGKQTIWVVDQPKAYGKWDYDEFAGANAVDLTATLQANQEVFGKGNRRMISDALQLARKWSADCEVKLSGKSEKTMGVVRRWFNQAGDPDSDVEATRATLLDGFKKITATCNSGRVIFSDRPHLRASGTYETVYASVNPGDVMPVIYIYQLFLKTGRRRLDGKIPKLWLCALTIVHELSHKLLATDDIRYDQDGLMPSASFPPADAIKNADSWAYFCGDVLGSVPQGAVNDALV